MTLYHFAARLSANLAAPRLPAGWRIVRLQGSARQVKKRRTGARAVIDRDPALVHGTAQSQFMAKDPKRQCFRRFVGTEKSMHIIAAGNPEFVEQVLRHMVFKKPFFEGLELPYIRGVREPGTGPSPQFRRETDMYKDMHPMKKASRGHRVPNRHRIPSSERAYSAAVRAARGCGKRPALETIAGTE